VGDEKPEDEINFCNSSDQKEINSQYIIGYQPMEFLPWETFGRMMVVYSFLHNDRKEFSNVTFGPKYLSFE
jgi:hypothetical protein